jgi:hypothetical protein
MKLKGYFLYHVMIIRKILMSFFFKIKEIKRENNSVFNIIYVGSCFDQNNLKIYCLAFSLSKFISASLMKHKN